MTDDHHSVLYGTRRDGEKLENCAYLLDLEKMVLLINYYL